MKNHTIHMILLNIFGWSCYAFADIIGKTLSAYYSIPQLIALYHILGMAILLTWILTQQGWKGFKTKKLKWHLLRAATVSVISFCVVNSFSRIPLSDFYGVIFTAPFLSLILFSLILKEAVGWHQWLAVIIGFIGVLILAGPQFMSLNIGYIYALAAVIFLGLSSIFIRKIGKGEYLPLYGFFPALFNLIIYGTLSIGDFEPIQTDHYWLFIAGSLVVLIGNVVVTYSLAHVKEGAILAPFQYIQLFWGVLFGYLIFANIPTTNVIIGLIVIISAGLYMIYREYKPHAVKSR